MLETPGAMIKRARMERGVGLEDLARTTRISQSTLNHIERDSYDELPAEVFVRGFLRNVAREVGLGSESIIKAYEEHTGRVYRPAMEQLKNPSATPAKGGLPKIHLIKRLSNHEGGGAKSSKTPVWERAVDTIGSAKPSYVIGSLVVLLGIALVVSVMTTASIDLNPNPVGKASWNVKTDSPKARWILDGQSNIAKPASLEGATADPTTGTENAVTP